MTREFIRVGSPRPFIACVIALLVIAAQAAPPPPMQGRWIVHQVAVDSSDAIGRSHKPDDPSVMNRLLTIGPDGAIGPASDDCPATTWTRMPTTTVAALVARNVRTSSGKSFKPTLH